MTKVFALIGAIAVASIVLIAAFIGVSILTTGDLKEEGTAYAKTMLETFGKDWDPNYLRSQAGREMRQTNPDYELIAAEFTQAFGTIEQVDSIDCPETQLMMNGGSKSFFLGCEASARSTKGQLDIAVGVVHRREWKTNLIWVRGMEPRSSDPWSQSVSAPSSARTGLLGEPSLIDCDQRVGIGNDGLVLTACDAANGTHISRR